MLLELSAVLVNVVTVKIKFIKTYFLVSQSLLLKISIIALFRCWTRGSFHYWTNYHSAVLSTGLTNLIISIFFRYGPPTRTDYRVTIENLSSRTSWQVSAAIGASLGDLIISEFYYYFINLLPLHNNCNHSPFRLLVLSV